MPHDFAPIEAPIDWTGLPDTSVPVSASSRLSEIREDRAGDFEFVTGIQIASNDVISVGYPRKPTHNVYMPRAFTIRFRLLGGSEKVERIGEGSVVVGSDAGCEVVVMGEGVAGRHVQLCFGVDQLEVQDLGSGMHTLLNGTVLSARLESGYPASIQIGAVEVRVSLAEEGDGAVDVVKSNSEEFLETTRAFNLESTSMVALERNQEGEDADERAPVHFVYRLKAEIARGGMGKIYTGEDPLLSREVAVKVSAIRPGEEDAQFVEEAKVMGRLVHPNIVPIYAMGVNERGALFYSMKLVKGRTLQEVIGKLAAGDAEAEMRYTVQRLLTVFRKVCDAVAYAHANQFIHRDLKPANVMIGEYGEVLVMDWGLAQVVPEGGEGDDPVTSIEGSPQYMSPEQTLGVHLDERTDIYALGGILYALLSLKAPVSGATLSEVINKVRAGDLNLLADFKNQKGCAGVRREIPEALRAVILKAMAKDREKRYRDVGELVDDIEAYLHGFATRAEQAGLWRQLMLLVGRHKTVAAMVLVLFVAGVDFTVKLAASERAAKESERVALRERQAAKDSARIAEEQRGLAEINEQRALKENEAARRATVTANLALADSAYREMDDKTMQQALWSVPEDLRETTWNYLHQKLDTSLRTVEFNRDIRAIVPHPKQPSVFVTLHNDGWIRSVNVSSGEVTNLFQVARVKGADAGPVLAVSHDGERLALAGLARGGSADPNAPVVYRMQDGAKLVELPCKMQMYALEFSPDGSLLLGSGRTRFQVWHAHSGETQWEGEDVGAGMETGISGGFSEDNKRIIAFVKSGIVELGAGDGVALKQLGKPFNPGLSCILPGEKEAFVRDGWGVRKCDLSDGQLLAMLRPAVGGLWGIGYDKNSELLFTATTRASGNRPILQVWLARSGLLVRSEFLKIGNWGVRLVVHPISGEAASISGAELKVWRADLAKPTGVVRVHSGPVTRGERGGNSAFLGESWNFLRVTSPAPDVGAVELLDLRATPMTVTHRIDFKIGNWESRILISPSQDGKVIGLAEGNGARTVSLLELDGASLRRSVTWQIKEPVTQFRMSPSGDRFWTGSGMYDTGTGQLLRQFDRTGLTQTPQGVSRWVGNRRIAEIVSISGADTTQTGPAMIVWDADSGKRVATAFSVTAESIGISPDGKWIAEGGGDKKIRIRNAETLEVEREFRAHDGKVTDVAWHPSLPLLVSISEDFTIKIWNAQSGVLVEEQRYALGQAAKVVMRPDGFAFGVYFESRNEMLIYEPELFRRVGR